VAGRGTGRYTLMTLPGYPDDATDPRLTQVAEPYEANSETGPYLSEDGRTWRRVRLL
jgi:hypothetical protein